MDSPDQRYFGVQLLFIRWDTADCSMLRYFSFFIQKRHDKDLSKFAIACFHKISRDF